MKEDKRVKRCTVPAFQRWGHVSLTGSSVGSRAVISGGAGFLGSHLCERLLEHGYDVLAVDNFLTGSPTNVAPLLDDPRFRLLRRDVTEYLHVPGPVDAVLHF